MERIEFHDRERVESESELHRPAKLFLAKKNILFLDPIDGRVRLQSRLDLLAIRERELVKVYL